MAIRELDPPPLTGDSEGDILEYIPMLVSEAVLRSLEVSESKRSEWMPPVKKIYPFILIQIFFTIYNRS